MSKYPTAELIKVTEPPGLDITKSENMFIQIFAVKPFPTDADSPEKSHLNLPLKLREYRLSMINVNQFVYKRPFSKDKNAKKENEFKDLWTMDNFYITKEAFPLITDRSEIIQTTTVLLLSLLSLFIPLLFFHCPFSLFHSPLLSFSFPLPSFSLSYPDASLSALPQSPFVLLSSFSFFLSSSLFFISQARLEVHKQVSKSTNPLFHFFLPYSTFPFFQPRSSPALLPTLIDFLHEFAARSDTNRKCNTSDQE